MSESSDMLSTELDDGSYVLRLYVTGNTPQSTRAIRNIQAICNDYLKDRHVLTIYDLYQEKERAQADQIVVAPTLIRQTPLPVRRLIGDLSDTERVLTALGIDANVTKNAS